MARITIKVEGLSDLEKSLLNLKKATAKSVTRRVLLKVAEPIRDAAIARAPAREAGRKTFKVSEFDRRERRRGALKRHITVSTRLSRRQSYLNRKLGKSEVEVYVGTRDRIGRLVEFGTARARAQPFLRPAWGQEGGYRALARIQKELAIEIEKTNARAARRAARALARMER